LMAAITFSEVSGDMRGFRLTTMDTVVWETPQNLAICFKVDLVLFTFIICVPRFMFCFYGTPCKTLERGLPDNLSDARCRVFCTQAHYHFLPAIDRPSHRMPTRH